MNNTRNKTYTPRHHVVMFSSGAASWGAARLVAKRYGTKNLTLLFADTSIEDEDNYRFLLEGAQNIGGTLVWLKDGRTPWDVFHEKRFMNHRQSNCSKELKILPTRRYLNNHPVFTPENTTLYVGIDFNEYQRMDKIIKGWSPWTVEAPLCWDDWTTREEVFEWLAQENIKPPRLYDLGFSHANCGGFCIKAGKKHFKNLLNTMPDRYKYHEKQEQKFLEYLGRQDIGILRTQKKGKTSGLTLKKFREDLEETPEQLDLFAWGGCGCFSAASLDEE